MSQTTIKRIVWTGAITAVTVVGAVYGAGLKTQEECKNDVRKIREASPEAKIKVLEEKRAELVAKRLGLEKKIGELERRAQGMSREESMRGRERRQGG